MNMFILGHSDFVVSIKLIMMVCGNALACTVFLDEGEPTVKLSKKKQLH